MTISPQLVQHLASAINPNGFSASGDNYKFTLPNAVGAGNCIVLGLTYDHGTTPTVTDNNGNSWPVASVSKAASSNDASIFVLPNANAGKTQITVSFGVSVTQFQYTATEFCGIATSGTVNGSPTPASVVGPTLSCGSFTPGLNDANGGNIVYAYFSQGGGTASHPTSFVPGGTFALLDGDIAWVANNGFAHASMFFLQSAQSSINPTITATGDTDTLNCLAVALKVDMTKGTNPSVFRIVRACHYVCVNTLTSTLKLQTPMSGNLGILVSTFSDITTGISDSDGGSWVERIGVVGAPQLFSSENRVANSNRISTLTFTGTQSQVQYVFFDVAGATVSPFDGSAGLPSTSFGTGVTSASHFPDLMPGANQVGLAFACIAAISLSPAQSVTGPSNVYSDSTDYTGKSTSDLMDEGDYYAHVLYSSNASQSWAWTFPTQGSGVSLNAGAAAFKGTTEALAPSSVPFGIIGLGSSEW